MHILICGGTGCVSSGSNDVFAEFVNKLQIGGLSDEVQIIKTGCFGFCEQGPIVKIYPDNVFYVRVTPEDVDLIVKEHVIKGRIVEKLLYKDPVKGTAEHEHRHIGFYQNQYRIALRNCGIIDPENINDYIAVNGYQALGECLTEKTREEVIDIVEASGLRGRGGAGVSTGFKWRAAYKSAGEKKYVICNADEGDPGAFMDRSILEGDPHSVLEAMAICGYSIGADEGIIYIRAEYPLAVARLRIAIAQAEEMGLLGDNILGTDFSFRISLSLGAGAFVCGEETSLINSVQGQRGEPRVKPPFPAQSGLWYKPSNVNNVETYANIAPIILNGVDWFRSIGTEKSPGTKVFALAGKINNVGLVEVPMGIPLRDIIYKIGGGIRNGKAFKAVQTGGPSGGCIPASLLDLQIDYDALQSVGSMMGSGGMIVMDEDDCMVNIAKFYLDFTVEESCGKCTPCRVGNRRLLEILERITSGKGEESDLDELRDLGAVIQDCSLCQLGVTAPNPVVSTLKYFADEYEAHVKEKRCPAGKCTDLLKYSVIPEKCIGCTLCAKNCPVSCISGERKAVHHIDTEKCIKCGVCFSKCPTKAIVKA
jgi:NADH:ubiquinone oxidoreductase subunit F (NADH-binding)/(2Fe-2S) ferredoxin